MTNNIVMATPTCIELEPSPIPSEWIVEGTPNAWNKEVAVSHDRISRTYVWECSEGRFHWHYEKDESVVVLSGEAFLVKPDGREVRFAEGDVGFFPEGTVCLWRVPGPFRKIAILHEPIWRPIAYAAKAWNRFARLIGFPGGPRLTGLDDCRLSAYSRQVG